MGRLFAFILVLVAVAAGAQANPAAIAIKPNLAASLPVNYGGGVSGEHEVLTRFSPVGPSIYRGPSLTTVCAFCTGHNGGVGWQPH